MQNEFANRLKNIQNELLNLKTNSKYTQARPINYTSIDVTSSGVYRITYKDNDENILSFVTNALPIQLYEEVLARTINGNTQEVEIYIDPDLVGTTIQLTVLATSEVINFEKIS